MMLTATGDQDLVTAARAGDDRAFEELYERYRPRIRAFALRLTQDADRAEDLTQEVFISALRRLRETDTEIAFRPWIYEIARNACIDEHRRRGRAIEVPIDRDGIDSRIERIAGNRSPEAEVESRQALRDLKGAFGGLSERHHRIIVARELEGKSYRQIGQELGMSQVVVESTLFRARRKLTEEFEDLSSGRRCLHVQQIIEAGHSRPRLGIRERRTVARHLEHCQPCRREALAAGFELRPRERRRPKVAAALFPVPILGFLRRGGTAVSSTVRSVHQGAVSAVSPLAGYAQSAAALAGSGRIAATAATVVVAAIGGGLITTVGQTPARAAAGHGHRPVRLAAARESRAAHSLALPNRHHGSARAGETRRSASARPAVGHSRTAVTTSGPTGSRSPAVSRSAILAAGSATGSGESSSGPGSGATPAVALPKLSAPSVPGPPSGVSASGLGKLADVTDNDVAGTLTSAVGGITRAGSSRSGSGGSRSTP